jgi:hypothetical protein
MASWFDFLVRGSCGFGCEVEASLVLFFKLYFYLVTSLLVSLITEWRVRSIGNINLCIYLSL